MYYAVLVVHSLLRWAVLVLGVLAVAAAFRDGGTAKRRVLPFVVALDLQLLVGLTLYLFLSPLTRNLGDGNPALRWYRIEHPALGVLATGLAHAGNVLAKRPARERQVLGAVLLLASMGLILVLIPWSRPFFRF